MKHKSTHGSFQLLLEHSSALGKLVKSENHRSNPGLFLRHEDWAVSFDIAAVPREIVYFHFYLTSQASLFIDGGMQPPGEGIQCTLQYHKVST